MNLLNFELFNLEDVDEKLLEEYSCSKNNKRLEDYLKLDAHNDILNLISQTHVLLDTSNNNIVGYFTLSFNWMKFKKEEKKKLEIKKLNHYDGYYPTVILNFFGMDDKYKGQVIEGTDVKYSTLLIFYFFSEIYTVLKKVPFSIINLYSYRATKRFYEDFGFTYIRQTNDVLSYYQYILPANRLDNLLATDNMESPFINLFDIMT